MRSKCGIRARKAVGWSWGRLKEMKGEGELDTNRREEQGGRAVRATWRVIMAS